MASASTTCWTPPRGGDLGRYLDGVVADETDY
jgi:hypothetical protein